MNNKLPYKNIKKNLADQDGGFCAIGYMLYKSGIDHSWLANNSRLELRATEDEKQIVRDRFLDAYRFMVDIESQNNGQSPYKRPAPVKAYSRALKLVALYPTFWAIVVDVIKRDPTYKDETVVTMPEVKTPALR